MEDKSTTADEKPVRSFRNAVRNVCQRIKWFSEDHPGLTRGALIVAVSTGASFSFLNPWAVPQIVVPMAVAAPMVYSNFGLRTFERYLIASTVWMVAFTTCLDVTDRIRDRFDPKTISESDFSKAAATQCWRPNVSFPINAAGKVVRVTVDKTYDSRLSAIGDDQSQRNEIKVIGHADVPFALPVRGKFGSNRQGFQTSVDGTYADLMAKNCGGRQSVPQP